MTPMCLPLPNLLSELARLIISQQECDKAAITSSVATDDDLGLDLKRKGVGVCADWQWYVGKGKKE